jgi:hypothetical protein
MYLIYNLARYSVKVNDETKLLEIDKSKSPMPYPEAAKLATQSARSDSENYGRQTAFRPEGKRIGEAAD